MSKKTIIFSLLIIVFLVSCGARGDKSAQSDNYKKTLVEIKALTEALPDSANNIEARRYLARVQKLLRPVSNNAEKNGLTIVPVNVRPVEAGNIVEKIQYLGDIEGNPSVVVYPKLTDIITDIHVENGDYVHKNDVLANINDATVRASKRQVEAAYLSAKSQVANVNVEYERMKILFDENAISRSNWDQIVTQREVAEAGLKQAEAALEIASTQLKYATITAPISGYVSNTMYEPGDMATPQKPFASIHKIKTLKIDVNVTESDLGKIAIGKRCEVSVSAYPDEIFEGNVINISPVINPMTRTAEIEVQIDNADMRLKPGMFARVSIVTHERDNVLIIDKAATSKQTVLKRFGDSLRDDKVVETYSCYIVREGIALQVPIQIGIQSKTQYEVVNGLLQGDLVVVMGQNNLADSTLIEIVK